MSRKYTHFLLVSTMLAAGALPVAAQAQDSGGDIVVTARRVEERLQDVPISITVFSQQQITDRNIVSAGDIATYTPSLTANARFGSDNTTFAIRGFTQEGQTSPSVAVYFADVVAPRVNGSTTAGNGAGPGAFFDLQNVQVLKGPQGTLFGRNTTGGAVLLVPQKPTYNLEGYVEGSIGNYDMRRVQAVINAPLADTFRVRLGIDRQVRDGYMRNISGIGPKDFNDVDYWSARASIVADLTPTLENYLIASWSKSDTNGFYPKLYSATPSTRLTPRTSALIAAQIAATPGYYDVLNHLTDNRNDSEQWQVINTTTWKASDTLTIKNIASYSEYKKFSVFNVFGEYGVVSNSPLTVLQYGAMVRPKAGYPTEAQSTFTEEFQIQGQAWDDRLTYQAGAYLEVSNPMGFQITYGPNGLACSDPDALQCVDLLGRDAGREGLAGVIIQSATKYRFRNKGVYAQGTFDITEQLALTGGIRYTWDKTIGSGQNLQIFFPQANVPRFACAPVPGVVGGTSDQIRADPSRCTLDVTLKSSRPTWMIDLEYKPIDDIMVYAKYARGYRQGSLTASQPTPPWGPEKVDSYEIGAKTSFRGAVSGYFNIAAFYNKFSDQQLQLIFTGCGPQDINVVPNCPFSVSSASGIGNAGKSRIQGVEIDGSVSPLEGLRLDFSYAYLDTVLQSITLPVPEPGFKSVASRAAVGGVLPQVPKHKYSLTGSYTLPLDESVGQITLSATYTHQDKVLVSSTQLFLPPAVPAPLDLRHAPSQDNLNVNLNWNSVAGSPIDLGLFVTNVTKEKYFVNLTAGSFGFDSAILAQPRMYGLRLKYRFGE